MFAEERSACSVRESFVEDGAELLTQSHTVNQYEFVGICLICKG